MMSTLCNACKASGLPILPVRYVPVPASVQPGLPPWASGNRVTSVALADEFHYAVRTLRSGYVYLFYEKNARGSKRWECYAVTRDGSLLKQIDTAMADDPPPQTVQCTSHGSNHIGLNYLVIEKPEKCGATWIAFSERKWSKETLQEYTDNSKYRNARMQTLFPAKMAAGAKHSHGAVASVAALEDVVEYNAAFSEDFFPYDQKINPISSSELGAFDSAMLSQVSTSYPVCRRVRMASNTVADMHRRAVKHDGSHNASHVLALWDAIGTVHELNGFRNDVAGWVQRFGTEREMQFSAMNEINGLKKILQEHASSGQMAHQDERLSQAGNWYDPALAARQRANSQTLPEPMRSRQLQVLDIQEDWAGRQVPAHGFVSRLDAANRLAEPARSDRIRKLQAEVNQFIQTRGGHYDQNITDAAAHAWPSYEKRIDHDAWDQFSSNCAKLNMEADAIIDRRTTALINWLEAPLFIDTLEDFHPSNFNDGMQFDDVVGSAIMGMGSHKGGTEKIDAWVKEMKASVKTNLLWRALALNQSKGLDELDGALDEAKKHRTAKTLSSALTWTGYTAKSLKTFADLYKKAQGISDSNQRASQPGGMTAFGATVRPVKMHGFDRLMITAGERVFRFFKVDALGDYASEKIIQHMFSIRAFVDPLDSERLVEEQAKSELLGRRATLRRIRSTRQFMQLDTPEIRADQTAALDSAWSKFKVNDPRAPQALRDSRLAVVVGLIEGVNFSKLMAEAATKGEQKTLLTLLASGMSIGSALFDVATIPVKNLPNFGSESWGYQVLKGWGGVLSAGASFIGAFLDIKEAGKNWEKGYFTLVVLFVLKIGSGVASGILSLAVTFTHSAPLISRLVGRTAAGAVIEAVGARAAGIIAFRILGMAVGGWLSLAYFALTVAIWLSEADALQNWIDHSSFGTKREYSGYISLSEQTQALEKALVGIGIK